MRPSEALRATGRLLDDERRAHQRLRLELDARERLTTRGRQRAGSAGRRTWRPDRRDGHPDAGMGTCGRIEGVSTRSTCFVMTST